MTSLSAYRKAVEDGVALQLKTPAGEPWIEKGSPVTLTLCGVDSKKWQKALETVGDRVLKTASGSKNGAGFKSVAEQRNEQAFMFSAVTVGWTGFYDEDGQELVYSQPAAQKLYLDNGFILKQVDDFVGERQNFWPASSEN